jgi:hypothetical protein
MYAAVIATPRHRIAVGVLAVVIVALCVVLLVTRRGGSTSPSARRGGLVQSTSRSAAPISSADAAPSTDTPPATTPPPLSALPRTDDPADYARAVVGALFGVAPSQVSRSGFLRFWDGELPSVVYSDAAAKGLTLSAQNADAMDNLTTWWIPSQGVWDSEAAQNVTSQFLITSVAVPDYWANAVANGTLRDPGLRMERVMGVLTQTYGADAQHRESSSRSVVIDLGLLCGPTQAGGCRLLAPQQPGSAGS